MFWSKLEASCVSSHTDELWYNETFCLWMTIYIYIYIVWCPRPTHQRNFFPAAVMSLLLYACITWKLIKKKLDANYTRMPRAIFNKSRKEHPTKQELYGHLPPILNTIQIWQTRHAGHCWRIKDELIGNFLLWTPSHGCASVGRPAKIYLQQLSTNTGSSLEDLPEMMDDRDGWQERVREIRATSKSWWWWWWWWWW